jgi:hypothetical protein
MNLDFAQAEQALRPYGNAASPFELWLKRNKLKNDAEFETSGEDLLVVRSLLDKVEAERKELTKPLNSLKKKIDAKSKAVSEPLKKVDVALSALRREYRAEKEAKALQAAEKKAARYKAKGQKQFAEDVRQQALSAPAVPAVEGLSTRTVRKARIVSLHKLLQAIVSGAVNGAFDEALRAALEKPLNAMARAKLSSPPGVEFYEEKIDQRR